jgi:hypothetical protein
MNTPAHKNCRYNSQEISQILPFKPQFVTASTTEERKGILKRNILPAMFNYWLSIGEEYDEDSSKKLAKVRNRCNLEITLIHFKAGTRTMVFE